MMRFSLLTLCCFVLLFGAMGTVNAVPKPHVVYNGIHVPAGLYGCPCTFLLRFDYSRLGNPDSIVPSPHGPVLLRPFMMNDEWYWISFSIDVLIALIVSATGAIVVEILVRRREESLHND